MVVYEIFIIIFIRYYMVTHVSLLNILQERNSYTFVQYKMYLLFIFFHLRTTEHLREVSNDLIEFTAQDIANLTTSLVPAIFYYLLYEYIFTIISNIN